MSGAIASMFIAVSASVSPLSTLDVATAMFSVSALSRFSAISNEVRVRVLGSKNRLTTVLPRSVGTFLIGRCADLAHRLGGVEDQVDLVARQVGDAEQILLHDSWISTSSRPSISVRCTWTLCDSDVGRFLPT